MLSGGGLAGALARPAGAPAVNMCAGSTAVVSMRTASTPAAHYVVARILIAKLLMASALLTLPASRAHAQQHADAISPNGVHFDPDRIITLPIGALQLNVPNKYLVFPWPAGADPASQRQNIDRLLSTRMRDAGANLEKDLYFKFDLPDLTEGTLQKDRRVIATIAFQAVSPVSQTGVDEVAAYHDRLGGVAVAVPALDTKSYRAFWLKSSAAQRAWVHDQGINGGQVNDEVRFARRDGAAPRLVTCMWIDAPDGALVDCHARFAFMPDVFPPVPATHPPYILDIETAAAQIDHIGEIAAAVTKKLRPWITVMAANPARMPEGK